MKPIVLPSWSAWLVKPTTMRTASAQVVPGIAPLKIIMIETTSSSTKTIAKMISRIISPKIVHLALMDKIKKVKIKIRAKKKPSKTSSPRNQKSKQLMLQLSLRKKRSRQKLSKTLRLRSMRLN